jgi:hypothetical protein
MRVMVYTYARFSLVSWFGMLRSICVVVCDLSNKEKEDLFHQTLNNLTDLIILTLFSDNRLPNYTVNLKIIFFIKKRIVCVRIYLLKKFSNV